jgi:hypothetical protein
MGKIEDLAAKYKISGDALQVYSEMGADAGISTEQIAAGFGKLQRKIADAMGGSKEAIEDFSAVGITNRDLEGGAVTVFNKIADLYKSKDFAGADPFKIQSAVALMGKSGAELIPMLEQGGDKYADILKMMMEEGRYFGAETRKQADATSDAWDKMFRKIGGLRTTIGIAMSPMLAAISKSVDDLMAGSARTEMIDTFKKLGETIAIEAPKFIKAIPAIAQGFSSLFTSINKFGSLVGWDKLILGVAFMIASPFIAATMTMTAALYRAGVALLFFSGNLAVMAGAGIMSAVRGVQGLIGVLNVLGITGARAWLLLLAPVAIVGAAIAGLAYLIYSNWGGIKAFLGGVWDGFLIGLEPIRGALSVVGEAFSPVISAVSVAWGWLKNLFGASDQSAQSFAAWGGAGMAAGGMIAAALKALIAPFTAVIDLVKVLGASWDFVNGKGFNFESSTAKLFASPTQTSDPLNIRSPITPANITPAITAQPQILTSASKFDGNLNININQQGRAEVARVDSSEGFDITTRSGSMMLGA